MRQLQTWVPNAVCAMVPEARCLTVVVRSILGTSTCFPVFLILKKKSNFRHSFPPLMGVLLAAFFISPSAKSDFPPPAQRKQEEVYLKKVLAVAFSDLGLLADVCPGPPMYRLPLASPP